ncbi:hypothetical protein EV359DRAFT_62594 [Lentinula novae-zelandiae]|nr:hypothetical protein EV359DRAFT_62594 [Lentinula novae-zelandiae]
MSGELRVSGSCQGIWKWEGYLGRDGCTVLGRVSGLNPNTGTVSPSVASKRKQTSSPFGPGEATSSDSRGKTSRKCHCHLSPPPASLPVVPPGRPSHPKTVAKTNPSMLPTSLDPVVIDNSISPRDSRNRSCLIPVGSNQPGSVQGSTDLVRLAAIAEQRAGADRAPLSSIKGIGQDLLSSSMPPSRSPLVPRTSTLHPYCIENERLSMRVRALEAQLAESQRENSSLTSALRDTSHSLEARQCEVEQLRTSQQEVIQQGLEYSHVLDQFQTLERALPGHPEQRLHEIQEELITMREGREEADHQRSASIRRNSERWASLEQQQGLVDESNALAVRQRQHIETLQEQVHQFHDRASFLERMVQEFPEEGFYDVSLPLVSKLEGELTRVREDLCQVATFAHRLYHSSPGSALQHHNRHLGGLIEAMIALLRQGLDSTEPDLIVRNFQLVLEYLQAA